MAAGKAQGATLPAFWPAGLGRGGAPRHRLVHPTGEIDLSYGTVSVGRDVDCELAFDDATISRRHAQIKTDRTGSRLIDLGSVNGTWVNGDRIGAPRALSAGDWITLGRQEMQFVLARDSGPVTIPAPAEPDAAAPTSQRHVTPTSRRAYDALEREGGLAAPRLPTEALAADPRRGAEPNETTGRVDALLLFGKLADKALAVHQGERAEQILAPQFRAILDGARQRKSVPPDAAEFIARYAVKLAAATRRSSWIDAAIRVFIVARRPLPAAVVDDLYALLRRLPALDRAALHEYAEVLRSERLAPGERLLAQRIAGLENVPPLGG